MIPDEKQDYALRMASEDAASSNCWFKVGPGCRLPRLDLMGIAARAVRNAAATGVVLLGMLAATGAGAQTITYTSRNGMNIAYCGPLGSGNVIQHNFSTPGPTADIASVSDPGNTTNWSPSSAVSQLGATPSTSGLTLAATGSAMRGPLLVFGVYATADARDAWEFTLSAPARFTFNVSLAATSTEPSVPTGGYYFGGPMVPDPGTPPDAFGGSLTVPGSIVRSARGRLLAGHYAMGMNCRTEGTTFPFSGTFNCLMVLEIAPDAPVITRIQVVPQGLRLDWTDLGPQQYTVETTDSLSGGSWTPVSGVTWPITAHTVVVPLPAASPAFYRVKMQ